MIDLKILYENPQAIEDMLDVTIAEHRQSESKKDWEQVKAERKAKGNKS